MKQKVLDVTMSQIKAARELLQWTAGDLAERAGIGATTLRRLESEGGGRPLGGAPETRMKIIAALQGAGIEFLENGVRLR